MTSRSEPLVPRPEVVSPADQIELVVVAAVGAASLALRVLLDALAGVTRRQPQAPEGLARATFAGLALGLVALRSLAQTASAGLDLSRRVSAATLAALPSAARVPLEDGIASMRVRERARDRSLGEAEVVAEDLVAALVPRIVAAALDQLDLNKLVMERVDINALVGTVDLDAIVGSIDVDAIAARLDVDALIERLDLAALARTVIDEIDLPEVIRRSTGVVASETVRGVRMQGIEADRAIAGLVDRLLRRSPPSPTGPGAEAMSDGSSPGGEAS